MLKKSAQTEVRIADLLAQRWSGRAYDAERPLQPAQMLALLEAARWAPSCYGDQPWRYLLFRRNAVSWPKILACLSEGNRNWAGEAGLLLLALADSRFRRNGQVNRWGQYDTGAASENLCLQASALGLMAHQMGGFDAARVQADFAIPGRYQPMAVIAVGYALEPDQIPDALREREFAARGRVPLSELCFEDRWEQAVNFAREPPC